MLNIPMRKAASALVLPLGLSLQAVGGAQAQQQQAAGGQTPPFGTEADLEYVDQLWQALADAGLVGDGTILSMPYQGREPHGAILEYFEQTVSVQDHEELAIVKKNYRGEQLSREQVLADPDEYLESITVMYRREQGYDPDNQNWFWSKHNPDGSLQTNPEGMQLAGRVGKGMNMGCIPCHSAAPGDDYVYSYDLQGR